MRENHICRSLKQHGYLVLMLFVFQASWAQSSYSFLNSPSSARLAALGGVNVSLSGRDVNFFSSNASLATDTLNGFASANYHFIIADIGQASFSYQHRFNKAGVLSFGIQHIDYGTITGYDAAGATIGKFSAGETALMVGKNFQSNAFRFGGTFKTIFSNLAGYRSTALAIDLGGLFTHPTEDFTIGLAIKNVGFTFTEYTESSTTRLPFDVQIGTTFKPMHMPFRFSITAFDLTDFKTFEDAEDKTNTVEKIVRHFNMGAELLLSKNVNVLFAYNFRKRQELKQTSVGGGAGLSLGLSVNIKSVELVLSRTSYGPRQATIGFALSTNLNNIIRKRETL